MLFLQDKQDQENEDMRFNALGLDRILRQLLPDAAASLSQKDRSLCHSLGAPQIQAVCPSDRGCEGLVCKATPREPHTLRALDAMSWKRPDIGSRVTREDHARFWERLEVKLLRATRHLQECDGLSDCFRSWIRKQAPVQASQKKPGLGYSFGDGPHPSSSNSTA